MLFNTVTRFSGRLHPLKDEILYNRVTRFLGRFQPIKLVVFSIQTYWDQIFILPKRVMKLINSH